MGFFYFMGKKKFYYNLIIAILVTLLILWGVLQSLDWYTRHGEVYIVPDFKGNTLQTLDAKHYNEFFHFEVIDSVYSKTQAPGSVVMQNPPPGSRVKQGRNVYLTVVAKMPEMVKMPNLLNLSLRQALVTLHQKGLPVKDLIYINYFARNAIVDQLWNGEPIEPNTEIPKGTNISLVVGKGNNPAQVPLPFLIGKTMKQARRALHFASLNVGNQYFLDGQDTAHSRVYRMEPEAFSHTLMNPGDSVSLWYRSDENFNFKNYIQQLESDTLQMDSTRMDSIMRSNSVVKSDSLSSNHF